MRQADERVARHRERMGGHYVAPDVLRDCVLLQSSSCPRTTTHQGRTTVVADDVVLSDATLEALSTVCDRFLERLAQDVARHKALTLPPNAKQNLRIKPSDVQATLHHVPAYHFLLPPDTVSEAIAAEPAEAVAPPNRHAATAHHQRRDLQAAQAVVMQDAFLLDGDDEGGEGGEGEGDENEGEP